MRALEPRILLDAAMVETALDAAANVVHSNLADSYLKAHFAERSQSDEKSDNLSSQTDPGFPSIDETSNSTAQQSTQIAFVTADVPDVVALVAALPADTELVLLDSTGDEMQQIANALAGRSGIDAIHLISHGDQGVLKLGETQIDLHSIDPKLRDQLATIGSALTKDGDILVYGCDFAQGEKGQQAANILSELTSADVAASTDRTGHASLGGDWDLEFATGTIEAAAFDAGDAWVGLLPTTTLESHAVDLDDVDHNERFGSDRTVGQTFNHGSPGFQYEVSQIDVVLRLKNNPSVQDITITIRESPTGPILATGTISSSGLTSSLSWQSIALDSPVMLDSGTDYVFMIETDTASTGGGGARVEIAVEHDDFYAGGEAIDKDGDIRDDHYTLFRLIGTTNTDPTITSYGGGAWVFPTLDENQTFVTTITATDPDLPADTLTYSIVGGYDAALFTLDPNTGDLSFINAPDYENPTDGFPTNGIYTVTVEVSDGRGGTDYQTISVTINDVDETNDAPSGNAPPVTTPEDTPVDGTVTMTDPDVGDTLVATLGTGPINGSVIVNLDGTYTYTPNLNFAGNDNFTVTVIDDGGLTDTVTVNVTVTPFNDAPSGSALPLVAFEDTSANGTVTMTDPDAGDTPEAALNTGPANGSVVVNLDGTYTYTPNANYMGPDSFTVVVTDDAGLTDTVTVNVTVNAVNDAPNAFNDSVNVPESTATPLNLTLPTDIDDAATDLAITVNQIPTLAQGTLTYTLDGGGTANVTVGTALSRAELSTIIFAPVISYTGPVDNFTYTVTDDDGLSDAGSAGSVSFVIGGINDAPDAFNDSVNVTEDTVTLLNPTLPNDIDDLATSLTITANQVPSTTQGILSYTLDGGGTATVIVGTSMSTTELATLTFTPAPHYSGAVTSFVYRVTDDDGASDAGSDGSVAIVMVSVADAPNGTAPAVTTPEDTSVVGVVSISDPDAGDTPEATLGTGPSNGSVIVNFDGTYIYTPNTNYVGADSFSVVVTDDTGLTDTVTVNVTVTPVNDAPTGSAPSVTTPEDTAVDGVVTMSDLDVGDTPEATLRSAPSNGSVVVNLDGTYTYTPNTNYVGTDSFRVFVTDDAGLTDTVTVNVTVTPINDAPSVSASAITTSEDTSVDGIVAMNDPDAGDTPEAAMGFAPSNGSVVVNLDGTYTYTPNTNYVGTDSFTVVVTDDAGLTDTVTVNVTVTPVNDAPVATSPAITTPEDTPVTGAVTMTDVDAGDTPEATLGSAPSNGSVVVNLDGTYTYTPNTNYAGTDSFTVVVTDDAGLTDTVNVNVTVTPVNDAPVATSPTITTAEDTPVTGVVTMNDVDAGDTPEATLGSAPSNGSVVVNLDGTYTYTPNANYVGTDSFRVLVTDNSGLTDLATVNVMVNPINDRPVATGNVVTTLEDTPYTFTPAEFTFTDRENDALRSITISNLSLAGGTLTHSGGTVTITEGMTITLVELNDLTFIPVTGNTQPASFQYTVNDADAGTTPASMNIAVSQSTNPTTPVVIVDTPQDPVIPPSDDETPSEETEPIFEPISLDDGTTTTPNPPTLSTEPIVVTAKPPALTAAPADPIVEDESPEPESLLPDAGIEIPEQTTTNYQPPEPAKSEYKFAPVNVQVFAEDLNRSVEDVRSHNEFLGTSAAKVTFAFSSLMSVGGATFVIRGGVLAAALMSALPAWGRYDPISIVNGRKDEIDEEDQSDADMMLEHIEEARSRVKGESFL